MFLKTRTQLRLIHYIFLIIFASLLWIWNYRPPPPPPAVYPSTFLERIGYLSCRMFTFWFCLVVSLWCHLTYDTPLPPIFLLDLKACLDQAEHFASPSPWCRCTVLFTLFPVGVHQDLVGLYGSCWRQQAAAQEGHQNLRGLETGPHLTCEVPWFLVV